MAGDGPLRERLMRRVAVPGATFALGVLDVLSRPEPARRSAARQRAEGFSWPVAVAGFLAAQDIPVGVPT